MPLILSITEDRMNEIIKREIAKVLRSLKFYNLVVHDSPAYCQFPASNGRDLDLDYRTMQIKQDYKIEQDTTIQINNIEAYFGITAYKYGGMHENPYVRPAGGPIFNFPLGAVDYLRLKIPDTYDLVLWEDEKGQWDGKIDWAGLELKSSMLTFVNK